MTQTPASSIPKLLFSAAVTVALAVGMFAAITASSLPKSIIPSGANFKKHPEYRKTWEDHLASRRGKPCDIIFIGDSNTERWIDGPGRPVWDQYYAGRSLDFGQTGDRTRNVLWRLGNIDLREFKPAVAVILIGSNDVDDTPADIAAGVKAVIAATKAKFPGVKIILVSILPQARAKMDKSIDAKTSETITATIDAANALIRNFADHVTVYYCDLASRLTFQPDIWMAFGADRLHLSTTGYEIWAGEMKPLLEQLLDDKTRHKAL